jgi:hypothetical protein
MDKINAYWGHETYILFLTKRPIIHKWDMPKNTSFIVITFIRNRSENAYYQNTHRNSNDNNKVVMLYIVKF